jgi:hypothetical protein
VFSTNTSNRKFSFNVLNTMGRKGKIRKAKSKGVVKDTFIWGGEEGERASLC